MSGALAQIDAFQADLDAVQADADAWTKAADLQPWPFHKYQRDLLAVICSIEGPRLLVLMKASRVGFTRTIKAGIAHRMITKADAFGYYLPSQSLLVAAQLAIIRPMMKMPVLQPFLERTASGSVRRQRPSEVALENGAALRMRNGNRASQYRGDDADVAVIDELDAIEMSVGDEGDAVELAKQRVKSSPYGRVVVGSTPSTRNSKCAATLMDCALVLDWLSECPCCGELVAVALREKDPEGHPIGPGLHWPDGPERPRYLCECGGEWGFESLADACEGGAWTGPNGETLMGGTKPGLVSRTGEPMPWPQSLGLTLNGLSCPHHRWDDTAHDIDAADTVEKLAVVWNQIFGLPYAEDDSPEPAKLAEHRAASPWVRGEGKRLLLTVDVQADRVICLVTEWGPEQRCRIVDVHEEHGPTDVLNSGAWQGLATLMRNYAPSTTFIDSGWATNTVRQFCKTTGAVPVRGSSQASKAPEFRLMPKDENGLRTLYFGSDKLKSALARRLAVHDADANDYMTFPHGWEAEQCAAVVAEEKRLKRASNGRLKMRWVSISHENHVWDCLYYALGAFLWLQSIGTRRPFRRRVRQTNTMQRRAAHA